MAGKKSRPAAEVNSGSMADIAFLLLIFFLVTTTIASDKGISVMLPPKKTDDIIDFKIKARNIFNVLVNSQDRLLVEEEPAQVEDLNLMVKAFITNEKKNPLSSDSPQKAVVSLKTDRGTSYEMYIRVYDELKRAYNETRADYLGITLTEYNALDKKDPDDKEMYDRARAKYPIQISDAEPTDMSQIGK